jgi:hypothetical protein
MFMALALSADRSCQKAVNDMAVKQLLGGLKPCSTHAGGYCRARQRLPVEMVSSLAPSTGSLISDDSAKTWQGMGRPVRLVDGTTVSMPDTAANQAAYPQSRGQKTGAWLSNLPAGRDCLPVQWRGAECGAGAFSG